MGLWCCDSSTTFITMYVCLHVILQNEAKIPNRRTLKLDVYDAWIITFCRCLLLDSMKWIFYVLKLLFNGAVWLQLLVISDKMETLASSKEMLVYCCHIRVLYNSTGCGGEWWS